MSRSILSLLILFCIAVCPFDALADEVTLKNGDRISGTIVSRDEEVIVLATAYAGAVKIDTAHIETVTVASDAEAPKPEVEVADTLPAEQPVEPEPPKAPAVRVVPKLLSDGPLYGLARGWKGNANIGFSYTAGNSANTTMTTNLRAVKQGGNDNITVYARSLWNSNRKLAEKNTTTNAYWGGIRYDRNVNDRLFGFVSYDFESDRPKQLNFRSVAGGGIGHHTVKNETTQLEVMLGGAWNRTWQAGNNTDTPEALLGNSLKHRFTDRLKLQENFTVYQNVTDRREFRYILDTTLSVDVTRRIGWFVTVGNRFNNDPVGTAEKNDFLFTTGIKWNFGERKN